MRVRTGLKGYAGSTVAALLVCGAANIAIAQTAPAPRAIVPVDSAPESMSALYADLESGSESAEQVVEIDGASWLQLQFGDYSLGDGTLSITGQDGDTQTFTQAQIEAWGGLTGIFNGSRLIVRVEQGDGTPARASIAEIIVGLPTEAGPEDPAEIGPGALRSLFGEDLRQFLAPPPEREPFEEGGQEGALPEAGTQIESICGTADNRTPSGHTFSGRIMPIGCTGWIIEGGAILTAGHCIGSATQILEFNVPSSLANGTPVSPPIAHQYRVESGSIVDGYTGVGNDWAVLRVLPNTQTGRTAIEAQGGGFQVSQTSNPGAVTISGYGVDGPPPDFGNPRPRNADNQTHQIHSGTLTSHVDNGTSNAVIRYSVDTQGGNSGSPVFGPGDVAIGIHTNGGCSASGGSNAGTSFRNDDLWAAVSATTPTGPSGSVAGWISLLLPN